jgi:hypothetical protein
MLSARIDSSDSPKITISWNKDTSCNGYLIYRKQSHENSFGTFIGSADSARTSVTDSNVSPGIHYEYQIIRQYADFDGWGYISAGYDIIESDHKGRLIILADSKSEFLLRAELEQYRRELIADGWQAELIRVPRRESFSPKAVQNIRGLIREENKKSPLRAVILFGRVPVAYAGDYAIDGHSEHYGAWPADPYYADLDGIWTDTAAKRSTAERYQNWNMPGDGKYDQTYIPTSVDIELGRIDFFNLPAYSLSETELLKRYLEKNHNYRYGKTKAENRAIIDDNFGMYTNEAFAANGWINFSSLVGRENILEGIMTTDMLDNSYKWAYGCGSGDYISCWQVAYAEDYVGKDQHCVFMMLFGSRFGDWDSRNNIMRIAHASSPMVMNVVWATRPFWHFHQMGLGKTIGYCSKVTMNNNNTYESSGQYGYHQSHMALLGDPTLKMHNAPPPGEVSIAESDSTTAKIIWTAPQQEIFGYDIYRAPSYNDEFEKLNTGVLHTLSFTDKAALAGRNIYLVRCIEKQTTRTGSFYHHGPGLFAEYLNIKSDSVFVSADIYPNPASDRTKIEIATNIRSPVAIDIYDQNGSRVCNIADGVFAAGRHIFNWDCRNESGEKTSPGIYLVKISCAKSLRVAKLIILP